MTPIPFTPGALLLLGAAASTHAADTSCAAAAQALERGLAQPRIHAAIDTPPDPGAAKIGLKSTLMHSIVIAQLQYSNAVRTGFSKTPLDSPEMRLLASDLAPFGVEAGCTNAGTARVGGREAQVLRAAGDLGRGEVRLTLWIDKASGLPLRAVSDEPDVDVTASVGKGGKFEVRERPNGKRIVSTHAYLFGDAVKPPGPQGTVDAAALAALQSLLKP